MLMGKYDKEFMISFADGQATFINEIQISDNIKFEQRENFLFCDNAILGHVGEQKYYDHELGGDTNKVVKINKFREDFLNNESLETIKGKSITRGHPRDSDGKIKFVDSSNFRELELGQVLDAWRDGDNIRGKLVIKDPDAIIDILEGKMKSLSLGYSAKVVKMGDGEYKQQNFYFNHLAMVNKGRAVNAKIVDEDSVNEKTPESIAEKHNVSVDEINEQLNIGVKIEMEHTDDQEVAKEIALDHLFEFPDYYTRLVEMEKEAEKDLKEDKKTGDEDMIGKELDEMPINKQLLEKIQSGEATVSEDGKYVEFVDEQHVTKRVRIVEEVNIYDDETNESTYETKTHEKEHHTTVKDGKKPNGEPIGYADEDPVNEKEPLGNKPENELKKELEDVKKELDDDKEKEKEEKDKNEKEFGDTNMTEEERKALRAEIIADLKKERPDAFGDLDPLPTNEEKQGYKLDFEKNEALKKALYDVATNPMRHNGDWAALAKARKDLF